MNIVTNTEEEILKEIKDNFTELWQTKKEKIDVCKICEFRHMCVDSAIPLKRKDGTFYREKECHYNPFISKWKGQKGYKSLLNCGIICSQIKFTINNVKLKKINDELWEKERELLNNLL